MNRHNRDLARQEGIACLAAIALCVGGTIHNMREGVISPAYPYPDTQAHILADRLRAGKVADEEAPCGPYTLDIDCGGPAHTSPAQAGACSQSCDVGSECDCIEELGECPSDCME